jgi:hypothetical protein
MAKFIAAPVKMIWIKEVASQLSDIPEATSKAVSSMMSNNNFRRLDMYSEHLLRKPCVL